jgi:hypothetical protein
MRIIKILFPILLIAGCPNYSSVAQNVSSTTNTPKVIPIIRKSISGNFIADGKTDTLKESVISSINNQEIDKYIDVDYDSLVCLIVMSKPICRLQSSELKPLIIKSNTWQLFGLAYLKNEGDLNNDGTDEVGLIVDWADWSNINSYQVYTYKNNEWKEILTFEIRDSDLDELKNTIDSKGFLYKDFKGNLIKRTYYQGVSVEKKIKM